MSDHPGPEAKAKRQILVGLSKALSALSDRMRSQGVFAAKLTLLAVRAEHIAQRSWDLHSVQNQHFQRECEALGGEIIAGHAADRYGQGRAAFRENRLGLRVRGAFCYEDA